jgi:sugar/nucleoside kinase (ribokinase family)
MIDLLAFNIILDDIALPDGTNNLAVLGGGGPQAAFGMRLFSNRVGIVSGVGQDLPESVLAWFLQNNIDTQGLTYTRYPTLRATQVLRPNGQRSQIWKVPAEAVENQLGWQLNDLPDDYQAAQGWHLGIHPEHIDLDRIRNIKKVANRILSIETFRPVAGKVDIDALSELLRITDIFSVNLEEAQSLVGRKSPKKICEWFIENGKAIFVLRIDENGSLVANPSTRKILWVPAIQVPLQYVVGAGNAYCGGFLTGWIHTNDIMESGARGAVAASLWMEYGPNRIIDNRLKKVTQERLGWTVQHCQWLKQQ